MAPRRGGGSSGGDGSGGSSSLSNSPFGQKQQLYGNHFHSLNVKAVIIILGICFVATCGVAIWALALATKGMRKFLRWWILEFSIIMSIIFVGNEFARQVLYDQEATVQVVYFLIAGILYSSSYLADISLLGIVYLALASCLPGLGLKPAFQTVFKVSSLIIINILIAFWATLLALAIQYEVNNVIAPWKTDLDSGYQSRHVRQKLNVANDTVFLLASVEILVLAVWISHTARKNRNPSFIGAFLIFLVAVPQLIRALFYLGYDASSLTRYISNDAVVAYQFFTRIPTVVNYVGIILVALRLKKELLPETGDPLKSGQPQLSAGTWENPALNQHQNDTIPNPLYDDAYAHLNLVHGNSIALPTAPSSNLPDDALQHRYQQNPYPGNGYPQYGHSENGFSEPTPPQNVSVEYGNPRYSNIPSPAQNGTPTAWQMQNQYNHRQQHRPVSLVLRETSPVSPVLRETSPSPVVMLTTTNAPSRN